LLLDTRRVLDSLIASQATKRATTRQRNRLKDLAGSIEGAARKNHLREYMQLDQEFDRLVEEACNNPFAVRAVKPLHAHCRRFWFQYYHAGDLIKAAHLHSRLMKSIAAGEQNKSAAASSALVDYLAEFTRQTMN
jgi:DNA-binding GntR family transcriptional regulator